MTGLANGIYRYWRDGELQAVTEPWRLTRADDGLLLQGQRRVNDQPLLDIEAEYTGLHCRSMRVTWRPPTAQPARDFEYGHRGDLLEWREQGEGAAHRFALPADALLFPLLRAAAGPLVRLLASSPRSVVLPDLRDPADSAHFLRPLLSQRRAALIGEDADQALHYRYFGGEYGETGSDYWLDRNALLLRYCWKSSQGEWTARLEDLWTAPGFEGYQ